MTALRIWINAGEASGDMHGASLIRAFRANGEDAEFLGMGGEAMAGAGFRTLFGSDELSLMGLTEVIGHLPRIAGLLRRLWAALKRERPDAVVLIDSPDFNFLVARMARRLRIPVFFYISPQVWAWRTGRVRFLRRAARRILCILPFEKSFYERRGVAAEFVGHPLLDEIDFERTDAMEPVPGRIGILPGSRRKEIATLLPEFAKAAKFLAENGGQRLRDALSFMLIRAPGVEESRLRELWPAEVPFTMAGPEDRYAAMRSCELLLAASGTVTLETALLGVPTIVAYKLSRLTFAVARRVVNVPFVSLPNLIMGEKVFPELLQEEAEGEMLAGVAAGWLADQRKLAVVREKLAGLRKLMGKPGAAGRAAAIIAADLRASGKGGER